MVRAAQRRAAPRTRRVDIINGAGTEPAADDPLADKKRHYRRMFQRAVERIRAEVRLITPAEAECILGRAGPNRPLDPATVRSLADVVMRLEWLVTGESIILDDHGRLLEGQHRLRMIVLTGIALPCLVVEGVDPEAFGAIGTNKIRHTYDVLGMYEVPNPRWVAGATSFLWRYCVRGMGSPYGKEKPSRMTMARVALAVLELAEASTIVGRGDRELRHRAGLMSFLVFACRQADRARADDFFSRLLSRSLLEQGSPEHRLAHLLVANYHSRPSHAETDVGSLVVRAWNLHTEGKTGKTLDWVMTGNLNFPEIKGFTPAQAKAFVTERTPGTVFVR